jgi:hypothetical protein
MEMDCIPSGMELFPAADEEQWQFIKKVIDDCDYYLLRIGGRYGSTTAEGISYKEKEYDYAIGRDLKVVALLHSSPADIPVGKSETDPALRDRPEKFRDKVSKNRLVKTWNTAEELPGLVATSLSKTIKTYPAVGWIRADKVSSEDILRDLVQLRRENDQLKQTLSEYVGTMKPDILDLASLEETIKVTGQAWIDHQKRSWSVAISCKELFGLIAPHLLQYPNEVYVEEVLKKALYERSSWQEARFLTLRDQDFQTIKVHLIAAKFVNIKYSQATTGRMALFWSLTPEGEVLMFETRTIRSRATGQNILEDNHSISR